MMFYYILLFFGLIIPNCQGIVIKTKQAFIEGLEKQSRDGKTYYAFTRIPYAKPPVGNLRFKNPVEYGHWEGTLNATIKSPKCAQAKKFSHKVELEVEGEEDCLYLNIYTPKINGSDNLLPVLIFIHGGGFRQGYEGPKDNADYFIDEDIVVVTLHYRVGILGFLSTEDNIIPGNFGLKDQAMAIKWVKQNIDSFGGDPDKLTLFGCSAGGASTHYHMISPLTKDLIRGAISQSGAINKFWGFLPPGKAKYNAAKFSKTCNCTDKDVELLKCLQHVSLKDLIIRQKQLMMTNVSFDMKIMLFRPTIEPESKDAYLPFDPFTVKTTLPWLTGVDMLDRLLFVSSAIYQDDLITEKYIENINEELMRDLQVNYSDPNNNSKLNLVKEKYFPKPLDIENAKKGYLNLLEDFKFIYPMGDAITRHDGPFYQYYFTYSAGNSLAENVYRKKYQGPGHCDELIYLRNMKERFPNFTTQDEQLSRNMVKMWSNFARNLNPSLDEQHNWPDAKLNSEYLNINSDLTVGRNLKSDVIQWWTNLSI